ncbi:hypothetical protein J3459_010284 [Metarhizium acridum]|nr:hypothetical protein J3459_010284 [Metarhizium acridum]
MQIINSFETGKKRNGKMHIYVKVIVKQDGNYYLGKWEDQRGPIHKPTWTTAHPQSDTYSKQPELDDYLDMELETRMENEIEVCERVRRDPHPNLAVYHGCLLVQGRVLGLIFEKYERTLLEEVNPQRLSKRDFVLSGRPAVRDEMKGWIGCLRAALSHLHSLGLVHNDLTPANIMIQNGCSPVIIDFGSACHEGQPMKTVKRTRGWYNENVAYAAIDNDVDALAELTTWLFGSSQDFKFDE